MGKKGGSMDLVRLSGGLLVKQKNVFDDLLVQFWQFGFT
jgi:hypothetical protein